MRLSRQRPCNHKYIGIAVCFGLRLLSTVVGGVRVHGCFVHRCHGGNSSRDDSSGESGFDSRTIGGGSGSGSGSGDSSSQRRTCGGSSNSNNDHNCRNSSNSSSESGNISKSRARAAAAAAAAPDAATATATSAESAALLLEQLGESLKGIGVNVVTRHLLAMTSRTYAWPGCLVEVCVEVTMTIMEALNRLEMCLTTNITRNIVGIC
jgi:hypothetical protein